MTDKRNRPVVSLFKTCPKGHDTTFEEHFIYDALNRRVCRKCAQEQKTQRKARKGPF